MWGQGGVTPPAAPARRGFVGSNIFPRRPLSLQVQKNDGASGRVTTNDGRKKKAGKKREKGQETIKEEIREHEMNGESDSTVCV